MIGNSYIELRLYKKKEYEKIGDLFISMVVGG